MKTFIHLKKTLVNLLVFFYGALFTLCLPLIYLRFLYRSLNNSGYRHRFLERLGLFPSPPSKQTQGLWLHAVSLGETVAAAPLVFALLQHFPEIPITITTTTPTGSSQVKKLFGNSVYHVYFPLDLPWTFDNFLSRINPKLCVIMETELWVNALRAVARHHIPCLIINARLSQKSFQGYKKISWIVQDMLANVTEVAAQSEQDGKRFVALGLPEDRLNIVGNIKFDCQIPKNQDDTAFSLKQQWGEDRSVWIAASTHEGEETETLAIFKILLQEFKDLLLILVPRHPERFNKVAEEIQTQKFHYERRSSGISPSKTTEVFLLDSLGELPGFYQTADVVFVGGSLVPVGGHNTLEPAALGKPVIVGPHTENFMEITKLLKAGNALVQISNSQELYAVIKQWLANPSEAISVGEKGRRVVADNRGAVKQVLALISPYVLR